MVLNKIKDFIYNFNDIVVALLILLVAGGVIIWRVADIMDYPEYLAAQNPPEKIETIPENIDFSDVDLTPVDVTPIASELEDVTSEITPAPQTQDSTQTPAAATGETKITIPSGSYASKIADILYSNGLITSTGDFLNLLSEKKADTKLKAGDFTIPAGSTMEEIIEILIK